MASATTTPQPRRGPLSHIVDALRLDNRQLLLETLRRDPRLGDDDNEHHDPYSDVTTGGGADTAAGVHHQHAGTATPGLGRGGDSSTLRPTTITTVVDQQLIFGSADLRRVILRQVMQTQHNDNQNNKKKKKKGKKNVTRMVEEEEILKDWNEELKSSQIVGTHVLSPLGDGSTISPYDNNNNSTSSSSSSNNPFEDAKDASSHDPIMTTYILRGGGFDLPSLSAAALHRRQVIAKSSSKGSRFHHSSQSQQQQSQSERVFRFVFVPRMTEMERAFLNELGVEDNLSSKNSFSTSASSSVGSSMNSLESLPIDLIPLDDDVLSLELSGGSSSSSSYHTSSSLPISKKGSSSIMNESDKSGGGSSSILPPASAACMRHSNIEGCEADVADIVARSLLKLQLLNRGVNEAGDTTETSLRGAIGRVQGLGPLATAVIDRMMTLRMEEERLEAQADEDEEEEDEILEDEQEGMMEYSEGMERDEVVNAADGVEITAAHDGGKNKNASSSRMNLQPQEQQQNVNDTPSIQALLVIDRKIDLVTPMLTPLTYEGLIDDVLQIQVGGCVSVKKSIVEPDDDDDDQQQQHSTMRSTPHEDPTVILPLNDSDPLYTEVRDKHVETFGSFLQNQAKALKESHSQFTNRETARDLTEIHQFVKQIPVFTRNLRSLTNHIHIAELVKSAAEATSFRQRWQTERSMLESEACYEALEDLIASGEPPYRWLRLFCLQSLTSNGIKATRYDSLRREVVQTYGYEFLMVLNDLEKAGFLRKRETFFMDSMATPYSTLRKALNLINGDVDPSNPEDAAYVSSGYAPMTVRWVQAAMRGYAGLDEAMKELPAAGGVGVGSGGGGGGRWVDVEQQWPPESLVEALKRKRGASLGALAKKWSEESRGGGGARTSTMHDGSTTRSTIEKPVLLVYFVGGVTFMELAALRFLSRRPSFPYNIVCCTTEIVNGGTLLRSLSC
mmetsp:Transcript_28546/g.60855  ORF Transcript_28546/g.60855 Transcript_28546/m.60855 type:complete len:959 (+) Transcript_28546:46-2922(+)